MKRKACVHYVLKQCFRGIKQNFIITTDIRCLINKLLLICEFSEDWGGVYAFKIAVPGAPKLIFMALRLNISKNFQEIQIEIKHNEQKKTKMLQIVMGGNIS